ncbi:MAG: translation elongation factor Ts [Patescibacteria group bacterium]|nr:translation elongation factor Ts [Patescibacteria group bacterium]
MAIDTKLITQLRELTGAGVADCKVALEEAGTDIQKAIEILRKKGATKAAKKIAERTATEGIIDSYIHANGKIGVLIQVSCETDFVARNEKFKELVHDLAIQIAGAGASYLNTEDVPAEEIEKEKEIYRALLKKEGKPENMIDKIMAGKLEKYYEQVCLLKQSFIKDDSVKIEDLIKNSIATMGEKIEVVRFVRYQI